MSKMISKSHLTLNAFKSKHLCVDRWSVWREMCKIFSTSTIRDGKRPRRVQTQFMKDHRANKFFQEVDPTPDDPRDPQVARLNECPHPETPIKYHPDLLLPEPLKGRPFTLMPFRIELEAGKEYKFCTCGHSKQQPFCDDSHKAPHLQHTRAMHIKFRPIPFTVAETREYWLCMCKQSNNRPFCDGSHQPLARKKREEREQREAAIAAAS